MSVNLQLKEDLKSALRALFYVLFKETFSSFPEEFLLETINFYKVSYTIC